MVHYQRILSLLLASIIPFNYAQTQNASTSEILPLLRKAMLVPQVIPSFNATIGPFDILYPQGIVNYGNNLSLSVVANAPYINFPAEAGYTNANYTLAMIDPDAPMPENPTSAQIRHWLVTDIKPHNQSTYLPTDVLSAYRSPSPPSGSAPHRYVFILCRQQNGATISLYNQSSSVSNFNFTLFVQQNSLTIVSANYFNASRTNTTTASGTTNNSTASGVPTSTARSTSGAESVLNERGAIWGVLSCLLLAILI